ncbi:MarR family winged helix-turn-helix transcriptional regulator [Homoserinimonas sp. A520]
MPKQTSGSPIDGAPEVTESALADDVSFLLARANALSLAAGNAALAEHGLRARSYAVLALVSEDSRPSQRELAEYLRLDPSQVVSLVDALQARGLVRREPDPGDRRANVVVATEDGLALYRRAKVSAREAERGLHRELTAADREQLAALLRTLAFPS